MSQPHTFTASPPASRFRRLRDLMRRHPRLISMLEAVVAVVVAGCLAFAVRGEWSKAGPRLENARIGDVALAMVAVALYYLVFILGWMRILATFGIRVPYRAALQSEMVSMLAKYVPGGVWTPAARVAALGRLTGETATGVVLASILIEAILSAISGVAVFAVSLIWVHGVDAPLLPIVAFAIVCVLLMHPRVFVPTFGRVLRPFGLASIDPLPFTTMTALLAFYCGTWLLGGVGLYWLIAALGAAPAVSTIPFLGGTAAIGAIVAVLAIFAPSGLGVREASMYALLIAVTGKTSALGATVLNRLTITVVEVGLFVAGIAIWRLGRPEREARAQAADSLSQL